MLWVFTACLNVGGPLVVVLVVVGDAVPLPAPCDNAPLIVAVTRRARASQLRIAQAGAVLQPSGEKESVGSRLEEDVQSGWLTHGGVFTILSRSPVHNFE